MGLSELHGILFNTYILFSAILGIWAAVIAGRNETISGSYWGSVATITILAAGIFLIGGIMALQGLRPPDGRLWLYVLYMLFLVIIMPGLFSLLRGRDDRSAALAFAFLAMFNSAVALSMAQRLVYGGWIAG